MSHSQTQAATLAAGRPRQALIHIGLRKAGSASIQTFLSLNEAALRTAGFDYPQAGREPGRKAHQAIAHDLRAGTKHIEPSGALEALRRHWEERAFPNLILSSEMLEGAKRRECRRLAEMFADGRTNVRILMIIRDLTDLMPSSYAQKVKHGHNTFDFDTFFDARISEPRVDFHQTAASWAAAFGWGSLIVRVLDPALLKKGDLIDDFLEIAGIPEHLDLQRPGPTNAAPGWRVLEAVRALYGGRHGLPATHPLAAADEHSRETRKRVGVAAEAIGERLGWNRERGRYLAWNQAERCLAEYRAAVARFNLQLTMEIPEPLGLEARGFVGREYLPDASLIPRAELRAFYDAVLEALPAKLKPPPQMAPA